MHGVDAYNHVNPTANTDTSAGNGVRLRAALKGAVILLRDYSAFGRCSAAPLILVHIECGRRIARFGDVVVGSQLIRTRNIVATALQPKALYALRSILAKQFRSKKITEILCFQMQTQATRSVI